MKQTTTIEINDNMRVVVSINKSEKFSRQFECEISFDRNVKRFGFFGKMEWRSIQFVGLIARENIRGYIDPIVAYIYERYKHEVGCKPILTRIETALYAYMQANTPCTPPTHEVKCWLQYYGDVETGRKPFEVRKDDRDYQVGDLMKIHQYNEKENVYTGRHCIAEITYKLNGGAFGIETGHCVLGIRVLEVGKTFN